MDRETELEIHELHARICKAIADPKRLLIINELRHGPLVQQRRGLSGQAVQRGTLHGGFPVRQRQLHRRLLLQHRVQRSVLRVQRRQETPGHQRRVRTGAFRPG